MLYLFLGQEEFLKKQAMDRLKAEVCPDASSGLNYEEFSAGEDDLSSVIDCARTMPFMSRFRLLVIKDAARFKPQEKEALVSLALNLPPSAVMVFMAEELLPNDPLYKIAADKGKVISFKPLEGGGLYKWIGERFSRLEKRIEPAAVKILEENIGNNLAQLDTAIELLATFAGQADVVTQSDVEGLIGKSLRAGADQILDAVGSRDAGLALKIVQGLGKDNKAVFQLIGLIGWQLRRIWRGKKMANRRISLSKIAVIIGVPQRFKDSFFRQMNSFSTQELERGLKALLKLDKDIKSKAMQASQALELLVIRLCAA